MFRVAHVVQHFLLTAPELYTNYHKIKCSLQYLVFVVSVSEITFQAGILFQAKNISIFVMR